MLERQERRGSEAILVVLFLFCVCVCGACFVLFSLVRGAAGLKEQYRRTGR